MLVTAKAVNLKKSVIFKKLYHSVRKMIESCILKLNSFVSEYMEDNKLFIEPEMLSATDAADETC